jgi:hypothetical protein
MYCIPALHAEVKNLQLKEAMYRQTIDSNKRIIDGATNSKHVMHLEELAQKKSEKIEQLQDEIKLLKKV